MLLFGAAALGRFRFEQSAKKSPAAVPDKTVVLTFDDAVDASKSH
jgi:hypothetical protein